MTIDINKLRPGDGVTLFATYRDKQASRNAVMVTVTCHGNADPFILWLSAKELATHTPKAWEKGDRAMAGHYGEVKIIGVDGEFAWCRRIHRDPDPANAKTYFNSPFTVMTSELERL
jgi:hypothetical protein